MDDPFMHVLRLSTAKSPKMSSYISSLKLNTDHDFIEVLVSNVYAHPQELLTFSDMLGVQEGNNYNRDLIFTNKLFISRTLKTPNKFLQGSFSGTFSI